MPSSPTVNVDTWIQRYGALFLMRSYEMTGSWFAQVQVRSICRSIYTRRACTPCTQSCVQIDVSQATTTTSWNWQASLAVFERGQCSDGPGGPNLPNVCNNVCRWQWSSVGSSRALPQLSAAPWIGDQAGVIWNAKVRATSSSCGTLSITAPSLACTIDSFTTSCMHCSVRTYHAPVYTLACVPLQISGP